MKSTDEARAETLAHAYAAGQNARRAGRDLSTCPTYALGSLGQPWRDKWGEGWHSLGHVESINRRK